MAFPVLAVFLAFVIFLAVRFRQQDRRREETEEQFWEREQKAKTVAAKDLTSLPWLKVPLEKFSFGLLQDDKTLALEQELTALSEKRLLNLTGKTNTELRETYGSPNLETMQAIGEDFDRLTVALVSYAQRLADADACEAAIPVLEYGLLIRSDVGKTYTLLADCYHALGQTRRIDTLREQVLTLHLFTEAQVLEHLDGLKKEN